MKKSKEESLPYARMITASEFNNASGKPIKINTFICRNVLRSDGGMHSYVDSKKRKMDDQAPLSGSTFNAPPTQQEEDPLAYLDDRNFAIS